MYNLKELNETIFEKNKQLINLIDNYTGESDKKGDLALLSDIQKMFGQDRPKYQAFHKHLKDMRDAKLISNKDIKTLSPAVTSSTIFFHELLKKLGTNEFEFFDEIDKKIEAENNENTNKNILKELDSIKKHLSDMDNSLLRVEDVLDSKKRIGLMSFNSKINFIKIQMEKILDIDSKDPPLISETLIKKLEMWIPYEFMTLSYPKNELSLIGSITISLKDKDINAKHFIILLISSYFYIQILSKYSSELSRKKVRILNKKLPTSFIKCETGEFSDIKKEYIEPLKGLYETNLSYLPSWLSTHSGKTLEKEKNKLFCEFRDFICMSKDIFRLNNTSNEPGDILTNLYLYSEKPELYLMSINFSKQTLEALKSLQEYMIHLGTEVLNS